MFLTYCFCAPAVVSPDVRCCPCCGECCTGAEPQSRDRSEAAELHLPTHLAAWNQPHELPTHGTRTHAPAALHVSRWWIKKAEYSVAEFSFIAASLSLAYLDQLGSPVSIFTWLHPYGWMIQIGISFNSLCKVAVWEETKSNFQNHRNWLSLKPEHSAT